VHCLTDGRDVEDGTSVAYMERLQKDLAALREATGVDAAVASGGGRMRVTMDRYEVWADLCLCVCSSTLCVAGNAHHPEAFKQACDSALESR